MFKFCLSELWSRVFLAFISVFFCFNSQIVFSQNGTDYNDQVKKFSISNPDVYSFEKYNLNPINHYVGKPEIDIPIFTIKSGDLEYPIKLVYDAGGIKVDQLASDVGLGWSLSKTLITRTVNQANDFDNTGSLSKQPDYNSYSVTERNKDFEAYVDNGYTGKIGYFLQKEINEKVSDSYKMIDFLPDVYNFHSNDFSTKFFFNTKTSPIELEPKGTKINAFAEDRTIQTFRGWLGSNSQWNYIYNLHTRDFFSINLLSNKGIKYTFNDCDYSYVENFKVGSTNNFVPVSPNAYDKIDSPAQISAWHITKIEDTKTGKKIEFYYETSHSNPNGGGVGGGFYFDGAQMSYEYNTIPETQNLDACHYYVPWGEYYPNYFQLLASARIDVQKKILKRIVFDEGSVEFNYNHEGINGPGVQRNDILNGYFLTQVYIKDRHSKIIKSFNFNYSQFISDYNVGEFNPFSSNTSYRYKRLKLVSLEEVGKPLYKFTYDETIKLPPVNSFSVDFLGYYNASPDVQNNNLLITQRRYPKLYYYPNQFEKSLLPFPIQGMPYLEIPGYFNRQANDYSKAWSLVKVEYPTGGSSEYQYESNDFGFFGQTIKGGGIRIFKQILNDGLGGLKTINYSYKKSNGNSSGGLSSFPNFGHPLQDFFNVDLDFNVNPPALLTNTPSPLYGNVNDWKLSDKSNLNEDITSGSFVGYSRVEEIEVGNGKKEYQFTSNDNVNYQNKILRYEGELFPNLSFLPSSFSCMHEFIIANSGLGANIFTDNSFKRGKLLNEKTYDEQGNLLQGIDFSYVETPFNVYSFTQPMNKVIHTQSEENTRKFLAITKNYNVSHFFPSKKTITTYDSNGQLITDFYDYTYNQYGFLKTTFTQDRKGNDYLTKYNYPFDVTSTTSLLGGTLSLNENSMYGAMCGSSRNDINENIQVEEYINGNLLSIVRKTFKIYDYVAGYVLPEAVKRAKGVNPLKNEFSFTKYENFSGNPVEMSREEGLKTVFVWGYNKTKIIAKIDNLQYSSLSSSTISNLQILSDADDDNCIDPNCKEQMLRLALNNLRTAFPTAFITTYTYDPLVGVTSTTDPRGNVSYFEYDSFGRLIKIKDSNGEVISKNEYNFQHN